ncbi:chromosome segregation protein SMC [Desulfonema ishimotonii]|uniref:Chromosome segregation protein SMC n=2 Tax=Desulfonema ishimotonii TaxID=45657 RepID=A0A401G4F9_9BACT|nr:chromosome segregation protein SMC [Desulfonema ishimotonii]
MVGGSPEKLSGILLKKQELRTLENQLAETGAVLERARAEQKATEDQVRVLENDLQKKTEQKNAVVQDEIEAQKAVYRTTEELKSARRNLEILGLEQEQLLGEAEDAEEEMEKYNAALGRIGEEVREAQKRVARLSGEIEQVSGEMAGFEERVMDIRLRLTAINAELESNTGSLRRLKSFQEDGASRLEQLSADIERKGLRLIEIRDRVSEHETGLARMYEEMRETEAELAGTEADYQAIDTDLTEKDTAVSEIQRRRETVLQKIRMVEVEQSQRQMRRENVENRTDERYHRPLAAFRPELPRMAGADLPPEKLPEALAQLDKKIKSIGNVNLEAIAEYEALKERFGFLETQRNDLVKAVEDLHKVIRKINRISQERFMKTFEQVNEKMGEVFPRLFQGGTARLILTEPDKPLDSGVEFMVHPPGKKLTRLTLLSGGEKALSAIAFVFSIFLIKPASFCILDEIDAPLDEANVFRFNELLKIIGEKSQIIMITHKRKSMEFADTLFGITMEQQGVSKVVSVNFETVQDDRTVAD